MGGFALFYAACTMGTNSVRPRLIQIAKPQVTMSSGIRARQGINCTFWLAKAGALLRCPPLAVLALRRVGEEYPLASGYRFAGVGQCPTKPLLHRLALHPAVAAKMHNLFLDGPYVLQMPRARSTSSTLSTDCSSVSSAVSTTSSGASGSS